MTRDTFCSYCGASYETPLAYPRTCPSCKPKPNRVLLFSIAPSVEASSLAPLVPNHETLERGLVFGPGGLDEIFAFPLHASAARRFFARRSASGDHDFAAV